MYTHAQIPVKKRVSLLKGKLFGLGKGKEISQQEEPKVGRSNRKQTHICE